MRREKAAERCCGTQPATMRPRQITFPPFARLARYGTKVSSEQMNALLEQKVHSVDGQSCACRNNPPEWGPE